MCRTPCSGATIWDHFWTLSCILSITSRHPQSAWPRDLRFGHQSKRAYGYEADLITLNEPEAAILREMARRVMAGHSYKEVAFWANAHGYRTTTGKIFYPLTVRNLLHKKRYAGVREHNGAEYPAVWEPVFDAETWERLQLTLRLRHEKAGYDRSPVWRPPRTPRFTRAVPGR